MKLNSDCLARLNYFDGMCVILTNKFSYDEEDLVISGKLRLDEIAWVVDVHHDARDRKKIKYDQVRVISSHGELGWTYTMDLVKL